VVKLFCDWLRYWVQAERMQHMKACGQDVSIMLLTRQEADRDLYGRTQGWGTGAQGDLESFLP
jgi:hypothetical protein